MTHTPDLTSMRPAWRRASFITLPILSVGLASIPLTTAQAADGTWNTDAASNWNASTTSPWLSGIIPQGADFTAYFSYNITTNRTITLTESLTIGNLYFEDLTTANADWTLSRSGASTLLTLQTTALGSTPTITVAGGSSRTATISAVLGGNQGLIKEGVGTLVLSGANTTTGNFQGTVTVNAGTLRVENSNAVGDVFLNATTAILSGPTGTNASVVLSGNVSGSGKVAKSNNTSILTLTGSNTYSGGTTLSDGVILVGNDNALGSGALTISRGRFGSSDNNARTIGNTLSLGISGGLTFGASEGSTTGLGDLVFTDTTSGAGPTNTNAITVNNTTTVTLNKQFTGGQITKAGTGTLILNGASGVWGATTVNGGTLVVNGAKSNTSAQVVTVNAGGTLLVNGSFTANNTFTVNAGGTLGGSGNTGGSITLASGATISPGSSPGTLTTGSETWNGGASYNWQVVDFNGTMGTSAGYDLISISGALDLSGLSGANQFNLNLLSLASTGPDVSGNAANFNSGADASWTLVTTTGGITGYGSDDSIVGSLFNVNTSGFSNDLAGGAFSVGIAGNNLVLNFTAASAIPEPSTYAAIAGALALGAVVLRRRRQRAQA